ncbi:MAG TPA: hypothetical protein VF178_01700 [Gemmatimonadaceae bacterium]
MTRAPMWRPYLRFWRSSVAADVDDELRLHRETGIGDLIASGLDRVFAV